jgi:hypothetical protein
MVLLGVMGSLTPACGGRQRGTTQADAAQVYYDVAVDELAATCVESGLHEAQCNARDNSDRHVETSCSSQIAPFEAPTAGASRDELLGCVEARLAYHRCVLATPCETVSISEGITLCTAEVVEIAGHCNGATPL